MFDWFSRGGFRSSSALCLSFFIYFTFTFFNKGLSNFWKLRWCDNGISIQLKGIVYLNQRPCLLDFPLKTLIVCWNKLANENNLIKLMVSLAGRSLMECAITARKINLQFLHHTSYLLNDKTCSRANHQFF